MSRSSERDIARRLAEREEFEPPADLLDRIKNEIPPGLVLGTEVSGAGRPDEETPMSPKKKWLLAASLVATIGAGVLALQMTGSDRSMFLREEAESAAEEPPARGGGNSGHDRIVLDGISAPEGEAMPQSAPAVQAPREQKEEALRALGYAGSPPPPAPPAAPVAPMEVEAYTESDAEGPFEGGVEGGVSGGVVGGIPGGVAGGSPGARQESRRRMSPPPPMAAAKPQPSTGGTAEPNDQPYGDVFYKSAGVNPFIDTEDDRLSTFGLDVDTGSYTVARRYLADGNLPNPESVRVEEFVNFFDYGDPAPARGDFAIRAEGAPSPFARGERYHLVRFNVRARDVKAEHRRAAVLTFVVDVSGSMEMENRLGLVKKSLTLLLDQLRPTDKVGLVIYGSQGKILLEPTSDHDAIRRAIGQLVSEGSTNAEEGISLGYDVAGRAFRPNAENRVILCSDGVANVGNTGPESILARIAQEARRGIELTTLGFGMGNYNDVLMEQLANKGDGRYSYIDTLDEAKRVLVEELTGTLQTVAKDAKVQVEWNPKVVARYRLLGYENRDIEDHRFRDETVDAGEIGAGHSVTALYEVKLQPNAPDGGSLATLRLRWRTPQIGNVTEVERPLRLSELSPTWEAASPALRLSTLVAEFAEILRGSFWAKDGSLEDVLKRAKAVNPEYSGFRKAGNVQEFVHLVEKAAALKRQSRPSNEE